MAGWKRTSAPELEQVPQVPVQVLEHCNRSVLFILRGATEFDALGTQVFVIAPEVVGVKEQEYAAARLVSNSTQLFVGACPGKQETCLAGARWSDKNPAFILRGDVRVFDQVEAQSPYEKGQGFVVVTNHQRDITD